MDYVLPQIQSTILLVVFVIWVSIWKGIALWKSARSGRKTWFIVLLVLNTVGILEILYIFVIHPYLEKKKNQITAEVK